MPIHDWTRVNAGTFHDFHCAWITHLKESLNEGILPTGYYAMSEQHSGRMIADVLTLSTQEPGEATADEFPTQGVALAQPKTAIRWTLSPQATFRARRRTLTIRNTSQHRVVAILEVLSPSNKDRSRSVDQTVEKIRGALESKCNVMLIDLFPPGATDIDKPLLLASYVAEEFPVAYLEPVAVGDRLPDMPLFLNPDRFVQVPLEATYQEAFRGMPEYWRDELER